MTNGQKPTMEDTYNLLKSSNFLIGRSNGKTTVSNHVANIVIAVSKNIKKTALKETKKQVSVARVAGRGFEEMNILVITNILCPLCGNVVENGQKYCHECGQALQYDY